VKGLVGESGYVCEATDGVVGADLVTSVKSISLDLDGVTAKVLFDNA
jgi:hypothetical protein